MYVLSWRTGYVVLIMYKTKRHPNTKVMLLTNDEMR